MKILAFAASNSRQSLNGKIIAYAKGLLEGGLVPDVSVETIDLNDYEMPIYSIDRQNEGGIPKLAHDFFNAITAADAVLISYAEHNGGYTAAYKNIFDWVSRIDMRVYQDKPAVLLSTSPGSTGGANVLNTAVTSGQFFGYDVKASLAIPNFYDNFDADTKALTDPELDAKLREALSTLARGVDSSAA